MMALPPVALLLSAGGYYHHAALSTVTNPNIALVGALHRSVIISPPRRSRRRPPSTMEHRAHGHGGFDHDVVGTTGMGSSSSSSSRTGGGGDDGGGGGSLSKPRILCLHGRYQSGAIFSNKIAGARRKLERIYELHFLDGPILLPPLGDDDDVDVVVPASSAYDDDDDDDARSHDPLAPRSWWSRSEDAREHTRVREAFEHVIRHVESLNECDGGNVAVDGRRRRMDDDGHYDAIMGFSQGGTLATALALSGVLGTRLRAVITAGAPCVDEALAIASELLGNGTNDRAFSSMSSSSSSSTTISSRGGATTCPNSISRE